MARIVVADDSWLTRKVLVNLLSELGHEVEQATTGLQALDQVEAFQADCLVLDLLMPEMTGLEVLEHLSNLGASVAVVVHTADIQITTRDRCLALGASAFLNKPVDEDSITKAIAEALGPHGEIRS